jgi:hypothetical protein
MDPVVESGIVPTDCGMPLYMMTIFDLSANVPEALSETKHSDAASH